MAAAHRPLRVKFILPALTEATSPYWRPIKYSLFPPLGLATLAAYLQPDDEATIVDEHVERVDTSRSAGPRRDSGLHHQRAPRLCAGRSLQGAGHLRCPRRPARHLPAGRGRRARRRNLPRPGRTDFSSVPRGLQSRSPSIPIRLGFRPDVGTAAADQARLDPSPLLSRAELDRRHARMSAALRLLLQGRLLRGRTLVLHAARRRCARRDRSTARPAPLLPRRSSVRGQTVCVSAVRGHAGNGAAVPGRGDGRFRAQRRSGRARRGRRVAQPVRRVRDARAEQPRR